MRLVMLDTETTGLIAGVHQIVEVAWSTLELDQATPTQQSGLTGWSPVRTLVFPHNLTNADDQALEVNQYHDRGFANAQEASNAEIDDLYDNVLTGATLSGANPAFDAGFLRAFNVDDPDPWHYRMLDVEAYAAGYYGWPTPKGLQATVEAMNKMTPGHRIDLPDHTAAGDVRTACQVYDAVSGRAWISMGGHPADAYVAHDGGADLARSTPVAA